MGDEIVTAVDLAPVVEPEQGWPRDFDFRQGRAEQRELLEPESAAAPVVSTPSAAA